MVNKQNVWHIGCSLHIINYIYISKLPYCDNMFAFIYLDVVKNSIHCIKGKGFCKRKLCRYMRLALLLCNRKGWMSCTQYDICGQIGVDDLTHRVTSTLFTATYIYTIGGLCYKHSVQPCKMFHCNRGGFHMLNVYRGKYVECGLMNGAVRCNPCYMSWKKLHYYFNLKWMKRLTVNIKLKCADKTYVMRFSSSGWGIVFIDYLVGEEMFFTWEDKQWRRLHYKWKSGVRF